MNEAPICKACVCLSVPAVRAVRRGNRLRRILVALFLLLGHSLDRSPAKKAELEVGVARGGGEPRAWRAVSPGLEKKVKLRCLTLLTLQQAGRVQTSAHPSNKRSLDLQSLPDTAERMVMWGLIAALRKLPIALSRLP